MKTESTTYKFHILFILLIAWNIFDIFIHVRADLVEALRVTGNIVAIAAALIVLFGVAKSIAPRILGLAAAAVFILNALHSYQHGWGMAMLVFVGTTLFMLLRLRQTKATEAVLQSGNGEAKFYHRWWAALLAVVVGSAIIAVLGLPANADARPELFDGQLIGADYWGDEPLILSAGMGFDSVLGLPEITEEAVREVGGAWYGSPDCTDGEPFLTSGAASSGIEGRFRGFADIDDGLPIVFSWPVAGETVDVSDFQFTLNTGDVVVPHAAGMTPNWEHSERNTVVVIGDFGNRGLSSEADVIFPVKLEIVADETPLMLVGPDGNAFSAVGLTWTTDTTPYDLGPVLVGAKLNAVGEKALGEGGIKSLESIGYLPNDEFALYDEGDFRLRVLTTGGFSPDGVTGLRPNMYEQFFRVHANGADGETVLLEEVGQEYAVAGGTLRVVGLSDLGQKENPDEGIYYDDCYREDRDNYIDIILVGDEAAARNVTFVEIPALEGGYRAFYNPGGPGPEPFEGVRYTAPGPPDMEPVIMALDNPMRVSRNAP